MVNPIDAESAVNVALGKLYADIVAKIKRKARQGLTFTGENARAQKKASPRAG
ncbi:hypothetical protein [Janthinobacterium aquaticum]|uniref:hypothetical protein n=1 Tax=Janthinobacterium sp. FT58W TaxID=2654254 RepID=UPI00186B0C35|nr:hypothetical protein [Janthinobacterium sp. FT58W]